MQIRIPTPNYSFLNIKVYVVLADIPLLLGLDVVGNEKLAANNFQNGLQAAHHGRSMPFTRKRGHLHLS